MKVSNLINSNGNPTANQFIILDTTGTTFQSYRSTVCHIDHVKRVITFGHDWDYSRTTMKYVKQFLMDVAFIDINAQGIRKAIDKTGVLENHRCTYTVIYDESLV